MDIFEKIYFIILPILITALLGSIITRKHKEAERSFKAADDFRNRVLCELKGVYPITQYWDMATFQIIPKTMIEIERAAAEFRFFVTRKAQFDIAINEYCNYCKNITWQDCTVWIMYPDTRKKDEISPVEKFDNIVNHLLSFANNN